MVGEVRHSMRCWWWGNISGRMDEHLRYPSLEYVRHNLSGSFIWHEILSYLENSIRRLLKCGIWNLQCGIGNGMRDWRYEVFIPSDELRVLGEEIVVLKVIHGCGSER